MARAKESYRGFRRNWAFGRVEGSTQRYPFIRLDGSNWKQPFEGDVIIKQRPRRERGWNYKLWGSQWSQKALAWKFKNQIQGHPRTRLANLIKRVMYGG